MSRELNEIQRDINSIANQLTRKRQELRTHVRNKPASGTVPDEGHNRAMLGWNRINRGLEEAITKLETDLKKLIDEKEEVERLRTDAREVRTATQRAQVEQAAAAQFGGAVDAQGNPQYVPSYFERVHQEAAANQAEQERIAREFEEARASTPGARRESYAAERAAQEREAQQAQWRERLQSLNEEAERANMEVHQTRVTAVNNALQRIVETLRVDEDRYREIASSTDPLDIREREGLIDRITRWRAEAAEKREQQRQLNASSIEERNAVLEARAKEAEESVKDLSPAAISALIREITAEGGSAFSDPMVILGYRRALAKKMAESDDPKANEGELTPDEARKLAAMVANTTGEPIEKWERRFIKDAEGGYNLTAIERGKNAAQALRDVSGIDTDKTPEERRLERFQRMADRINAQQYWAGQAGVSRAAGPWGPGTLMTETGGLYQMPTTESEETRQQLIARARRGDMLAYQQLGRLQEANAVLNNIVQDGQLSETALEKLKGMNNEMLRQMMNSDQAAIYNDLDRLASRVDYRTALDQAAAQMQIDREKLQIALSYFIHGGYTAGAIAAGILVPGFEMPGVLESLIGRVGQRYLEAEQQRAMRITQAGVPTLSSGAGPRPTLNPPR